MNGLLELLTTKKWMMQPEALDAFRHVIQQNLSGHIALGQFEKRMPYRISQVLNGSSVEFIRMEANTPVRMEAHYEHEEQEGAVEVQSFVTVLPVCGPITRNGDACSYGSIDLRDAVMEAADEDECNGIVFYINSPGGSAAAIADYKYAINYLHERGKKCVAFVDGMCASAAMYLAALCDERYYMNEQDQVGSIGTMAAFYTEKDGSTNQYTNETYHELYADASYEKNKWYRDAANGEYEELLADLNRTNEQFLADVKAACPNATDEHLHGKIFDAKDIDGILMDGQSTLDIVINALITSPLSSDTSLDNDKEACKPKRCEDIPVNNEGGSTTAPSAQTQNIINMNNYPLTQAALGVESLVVTEEGSHLDVSLLDNCEAALTAKDAKITELTDGLAAAQQQLADTQAHAKEIEEQLATAQSMAEEAQKNLTEATEAHEKAMNEISEKVAETEKDLAGAKEALATAEQQLSDRDAQIAQLTAEPAPAQEEGESPANNGAELQHTELRTDYPVWDGKEDMVAFKARREAWHKSHNL